MLRHFNLEQSAGVQGRERGRGHINALRTFAHPFGIRTTFADELLPTNMCMCTCVYRVPAFLPLGAFANEVLRPNIRICTFVMRTCRYLLYTHTYFCRRTFANENLVHVLLTHVFYSLCIFAYEYLRACICSTHFSDTYFDPSTSLRISVVLANIRFRCRRGS